ncbi:hypothetical protein SAMN05443637_1202 [Pseudonocardia thermophila]|jgi:hypothetical protein|uniref:Uncharacterized protein n=1 Tax=Pseudonocardia thermophila TaxID=1848 RepID=A0A1M6YH72_PSETH|nr:hypothetical protein [Pseudonocardia thermophila]SHL17460.1 hypothetical protein SAMN05443637_1202 [Pseudonocardia thermophila]
MNQPATAPLDELARRRAQWRASGEALFPTLTTDPTSYARAVEAIGVLAAALARRGAGLDDLVAAMGDPEALLAESGVRPPAGVPPALLVGVACGMRERELIAERVRAEHRAAIERARASGSTWAVLHGPAAIEDLTGGDAGVAGCTHLHVPSGTEIRASVDAWSPAPYRIDVIRPGVVPPEGRSFDRREPFLEEYHRCRRMIEETP